VLRRVFVDANVLIAGADSRSGASNAVMKLAEIGLIQLVVARQVLDEAERNLRKNLPRALPNFAAQLAQLRLEIVPDPPQEAVEVYETFIEATDAPILAAAVLAAPDRFITLNTRDFTAEVAVQSRLVIQTPGQFIQTLRSLVDEGLANN
jgi:predicted nucleic acid-binding protein